MEENWRGEVNVNSELEFPSQWSEDTGCSRMFYIDKTLLWQSSPGCQSLRSTHGEVKPEILYGISGRTSLQGGQTGNIW